MNEYRCGACGKTYRGFPFDRFIEVVERHKTECEGDGNESSESEQQMSEKFTAGSGKTYWRGFYGYLQETEGVVLGPKKAEDVKEFFLWERDRELGRWRDPEAPNMVVYPAGDGSVRVRDETDGSGCLLNRKFVAENDSGTALTAYRYFQAHPAPRELPTALGTIIEGNGHQAILADLDDEPWQYVGVGTLRTDGIPVWMSVSRALELVGPDWRVIHERDEKMMSDFHRDLTSLLNRYSAESVSGTPDFILASFLQGVLKEYNEAVSRRAEWRGETCEPRSASRQETVVAAETLDPEPWFTLKTRSPFAFFRGVVSPVGLSPSFESVVDLAKDQIARPQDIAAKDRLEIECRSVADMLVQVAAEDGHAILLARALQALVLRIAEKEADDE